MQVCLLQKRKVLKPLRNVIADAKAKPDYKTTNGRAN